MSTISFENTSKRYTISFENASKMSPIWSMKHTFATIFVEGVQNKYIIYYIQQARGTEDLQIPNRVEIFLIIRGHL
jgi:hypothetical protein